MTESDQAGLTERAAALLRAYEARGWRIASAESCTGGLLAALLTEIAGSSAVVDRGFVTYSNEAKTDMLGVEPALLAAHGAVSEPVARAMAEGALARSPAQVAVAVTGIAGPAARRRRSPSGSSISGWPGRGAPRGTSSGATGLGAVRRFEGSRSSTPCRCSKRRFLANAAPDRARRTAHARSARRRLGATEP
jgi:nicotinamide-nucleotide amidase